MHFIEVIRSVLINISENKVKVLLTMLGIVVGTITVIIVLAVGRGSQADVETQYKNLNVGTLQITPAFGRNVTASKLNEEVAGLITENSDTLKYVSMVQNTRGAVNYDGLSNNISVIGATEPLMAINNLELAYGRFVTAEDNDNKEKVAVIGMTTAETYFEEDVTAAIGQDITIEGRKFEVVGILKYQGNSNMREMNPDESVIIPYKVAEKYMTGRMARPSIMVLTKKIDDIEMATSQIQTVLDDYFKSDSESFMIINAGSRLEAAKASAKTITMMLLIVAVVVLIVGGIGIMNVLFVSVKERTREIGILKAIGAKRRDILKIFLYEAIIISFLGGITGVLLSLISVPIFNYFDVNVIVMPVDLLIALGFSMGIGTFFGIYPAAKAAAMKPIDALNYE
jgi:putative ABC transport system permease protein